MVLATEQARREVMATAACFLEHDPDDCDALMVPVLIAGLRKHWGFVR